MSSTAVVVTTTASPWLPTHQQALELEVSLLKTLLHRNRASHRRTKYFQRLSMALQALQRHDVLKLYDQLQQLLQQQQQQQQRQTKTNKKRPRDNDQVFWSLTKANDKDSDTVAAAASRKDNNNNHWEELTRTTQCLVQQGLPECLDRLEYAAQTLFGGEISRGFFLPLCTTAVAMTSRIRTLLLRLGRYAMEVLLLLTSCCDVGARIAEDPAWARARAIFWATTKSSSSNKNQETTEAAVACCYDVQAWTRADRTRVIRASLGLPHAQRTSGSHPPRPPEGGAGEMVHEAADVVLECNDTDGNHATTAHEAATTNNNTSRILSHPAAAAADDDDDDDDIGESVVDTIGIRPLPVARFGDDDDNDNTSLAFVWGAAASKKEDHYYHVSDRVDRNAEMVQHLKQSQSKKKRKDDKGGGADGAFQKKKKRSKTKKGDFFDNLFDKK